MSERRRKPRVREVIVVEGRYDKNALSQVVDALIFETGGFAIFHDQKRREALKMLAGQRGLIILTDSDGAGFVIRGYLKGILPEDQIRQAFIPAIHGKENRKKSTSRQGLLGVEGMKPEILIETLRKAGATIDEKNTETQSISAAEFYRLGLTGKPGAEERRNLLVEKLGLPDGISQKDLRKAIGALMSEEELEKLLTEG